jgi:hypothetical protein
VSEQSQPLAEQAGQDEHDAPESEPRRTDQPPFADEERASRVCGVDVRGDGRARGVPLDDGLRPLPGLETSDEPRVDPVGRIGGSSELVPVGDVGVVLDVAALAGRPDGGLEETASTGTARSSAVPCSQ